MKHRGQTIDFDWAKASGENVIQWAAFYGDCEHEVMEVTAGNRVTLTYNLYYSRVGETDRGVHLPHQLPLYNIVRDMLQEPTFLRNGRFLSQSLIHQSRTLTYSQVVSSAFSATTNTLMRTAAVARVYLTLSKE